MSKLTAQISLFDINTSKEMILTQVNAFNPFPEKASQGILVSRISHPMTNPAMWIKYLATGEIYYVHLPLAYEINSVLIDGPIDESKVPDYGEEVWMTFDEFFRSESQSFITNECYSKANLNKSIAISVVQEFSITGLPIFRPSHKAHLEIVREAFNLIAQGDYYTAFCFIDYACRTGAYEIDGREYRESYSVFEFTGHRLGWYACPSVLIDHRWATLERGKSNIASETAREAQSFLVLSTRMLALKELKKTYTGTALIHINNTIEIIESRLKEVMDELCNKRDKTTKETYLNQVLKYIPSNKLATPLISHDGNNCTFCGVKHSDNAVSCSACGAPIPKAKK